MKAAKPNVLFLPKWYPHPESPFDGNFIQNYAHAIQSVAEIKVIFVHSAYDAQSDKFSFHLSNNHGIEELRVYFKPLRSGFGLFDKLINAIRYRRAQIMAYAKLYQKGSTPDLVHLHVLARSSPLALRLLKKLGTAFVISEHWSGYLPESRALRKSGKTLYYRFIANKAARIHTVTTKLAESMKEHGIDNQFSVIPNVVDTSIFTYQEEAAGSDRELKYILFVGNLLQHPKRIMDIMDCIADLAGERSDFILNIYGEGDDEALLRSKIRELKLLERVELYGTADQGGIAKAMRGSDFLILFSEFESQPCVINEALCCGCPVVVPDIEGIAEFMQDDFGLLFKRLDKADFKKSISLMLDKPDAFDRRSISELASSKFGQKTIAGQFADFYQLALSEK